MVVNYSYDIQYNEEKLPNLTNISFDKTFFLTVQENLSIGQLTMTKEITMKLIA